jgi:hypothetical protein
MPGEHWPREEIELVRSLAPDYETLERLLLERTRTQIRNRASKLGMAPTHRAFLPRLGRGLRAPASFVGINHVTVVGCRSEP